MTDPNILSQTGVASGDTAAHHTNGIVDKVRSTAAEQLTSQKKRATDGLGTVAQAARSSTQQLRDQQHDTMAGYADQVADQIDRLSQRLRDKDVAELMRDVQQIARRQPALFIGGAFALGLLGARFFKSSASSGDRQWRDSSRGASGGDISTRTSAMGSEWQDAERSASRSYEPDYTTPRAVTGEPSTETAGEASRRRGSSTTGGRQRRSTPTES